MAHFGMHCPPTPGHLNPMMALGRSLISRGHRVSMFAIADIEESVRKEGLGFWPLGTDEFPPGSLGTILDRLARLEGFAALRFSMEHGRRLAEMICRHGPPAVQKARPDVLIVDQNEPAGGTVAEHLRIPFVNVVSLPINREPGIPPPFVPWHYSDTVWARWRNQLGYRTFDWLVSAITRQINSFRVRQKLHPIRIPDDTFSRLAQISQLTRDFDFPRRQLPPYFHYTGPFLDAKRAPVEFPFDKLNGRPIVYASFGTLQTRLDELLYNVAEACAGLPVQLVISLGSARNAPGQYSFKGDPIVVSFAPQLELLPRASLMITHGGLNSVQEGLRFAVPMLALPITNDQPAVSARLELSGAGRAIPAKKATVERLRAAIQDILTQASFRQAAQRMQQSTIAAGGVEEAANIIEGILQKGTIRWPISPTT